MWCLGPTEKVACLIQEIARLTAEFLGLSLRANVRVITLLRCNDQPAGLDGQFSGLDKQSTVLCWTHIIHTLSDLVFNTLTC